jgi:copper chaperone CopZ
MNNFRMLAIGLLIAASAGKPAIWANEPPELEPTATKLTLLVTGLHCPPCTRTVENSLRGVKGVKSAQVDWKTKNAKIELDESVLSAQALVHKLASTPHMMGKGMHYGSWLALKIPAWDDATAQHAESVLKAIAGVKKVTAFAKQKTIGVQFDVGTALTSHALIDALHQVGLSAATY